MRRTNIELLKTPKIRAEIERYKWIESEKEGFDIGIERANHEWLSLYAITWLKAHPSKKRPNSKKRI